MSRRSAPLNALQASLRLDRLHNRFTTTSGFCDWGLLCELAGQCWYTRSCRIINVKQRYFLRHPEKICVDLHWQRGSEVMLVDLQEAKTSGCRSFPRISPYSPAVWGHRDSAQDSACSAACKHIRSCLHDVCHSQLHCVVVQLCPGTIKRIWRCQNSSSDCR